MAFKVKKPLGFYKGNNYGKGGQRVGAGRPTAEFKDRCSRLANNPNFFIWATSVFKGKPVEPRLTKDGAIVYLEASVSAKTFLWEKMAERGFGRPIQPMEIEHKEDADIKELSARAIFQLIEALKD